MKKTLLPLALIFSTTSLFAANFFSGEAGICANFINETETDSDEKKPALLCDGFVRGQISISNALSFRGEFSLQTDDLYNQGLTKETLALFQINEISASYTKSFGGATHTFNVFNGNFENIGSQLFIRRRLGIEDYSTPLMQTFLGLKGPYAYQLHGFGGGYSITPKFIPFSMGLVISKNTDTTEIDNGDGSTTKFDELNGDFRLAIALRYLTVDFLAGAGVPLKTNTKDENGNDVFLQISKVYLHSGIDLLLGNKYSPLSLYALAGIDHVGIDTNGELDEIELKDLFVIAEQRFNLGEVKLYVSAFNIPKENLTHKNTGFPKFFLIEDTLGANVRLFSDSCRTKNGEISVGVNATVTFEKENKDYYADDLKDYYENNMNEDMKFKLSPFTELNACGGKISAMLQLNLTDLEDKKPGAIKFNLGYRREL